MPSTLILVLFWLSFKFDAQMMQAIKNKFVVFFFGRSKPVSIRVTMVTLFWVSLVLPWSATLPVMVQSIPKFPPVLDYVSCISYKTLYRSRSNMTCLAQPPHFVEHGSADVLELALLRGLRNASRHFSQFFLGRDHMITSAPCQDAHSTFHDAECPLHQQISSCQDYWRDLSGLCLWSKSLPYHLIFMHNWTHRSSDEHHDSLPHLFILAPLCTLHLQPLVIALLDLAQGGLHPSRKIKESSPIPLPCSIPFFGLQWYCCYEANSQTLYCYCLELTRDISQSNQ